MPFACDAARSDRTLWKELACGRATSLSALGDAVEDDYLPGLGTLKGWGLEYEPLHHRPFSTPGVVGSRLPLRRRFLPLHLHRRSYLRRASRQLLPL